MDDEIRTIVQKFAKAHDANKRRVEQYQQQCAQFNAIMDKYFDKLAGNRKNAVFKDTNGDTLTVTRVAPTSIRWLPDKLKKRVTKPMWKKLVKKKYEIVDINGLVQYLKSCGVDPVIFKGYIEVTETVDPEAIERLGDLGELTPHNIAGCYIVECSKTYYRLTRKVANAEQSEE